VSIVSIDDITNESKGIAWITLFTCLSVLLLILIIAILGSRKMYKPLGILSDFVRSTLDKPSAGSGGGGDELTMISEHIHRLTEKQSSMADLMTGQLQQMKELFTIKLIQGDLSGSELSDKLNVFPHAQSWKHMTLFTLQIDTLEGTRYEERNRFLLMFAINNIVSELIPETERLCPIIHHDSQVTVNRKWLLVDMKNDDVFIKVLLIRVADGHRYDIGNFYSPPELRGDVRCDLHPRWSRDGSQVCIDSAHEGTRQIYVLDVAE
jgi:hypothetical protein